MSETPLNMHRKDMKIEGNRDLYSYTFTDPSGRVIEPEPPISVAKEPEGNLGSQQGEDRKE